MNDRLGAWVAKGEGESLTEFISTSNRCRVSHSYSSASDLVSAGRSCWTSSECRLDSTFIQIEKIATIIKCNNRISLISPFSQRRRRRHIDRGEEEVRVHVECNSWNNFIGSKGIN